jgi:transposase
LHLAVDEYAIPAGDAALVKFSLSTGNASDAKERRPLLKSVRERESAMLLMGKAYEGNETVAKETPALLLSCRRSTAAKKLRDYNRELYKERNDIERFFRRVYARYDKLDTMFSAFIYLASINMALHRMNTSIDRKGRKSCGERVWRRIRHGKRSC